MRREGDRRSGDRSNAARWRENEQPKGSAWTRQREPDRRWHGEADCPRMNPRPKQRARGSRNSSRRGPSHYVPAWKKSQVTRSQESGHASITSSFDPEEPH